MSLTREAAIAEACLRMSISLTEIDEPTKKMLLRDMIRFESEIMRECHVPPDEVVLTLESDVKQYVLPPDVNEIRRVFINGVDYTNNQVSPEEIIVL